MKLSFKLIIIPCLLVISCKDVKSPEPILEENFDTVVNSEDFGIMMEPTIIAHFIDSLGFDQLVKKHGDDAETILDDMMWYDHQMSMKADSLEIPVISSNQRVLKVKYHDTIFEHTQDTASGYVSYYYFDGKTITDYDILEMIELLKKE